MISELLSKSIHMKITDIDVKYILFIVHKIFLIVDI